MVANRWLINPPQACAFPGEKKTAPINEECQAGHQDHSCGKPTIKTPPYHHTWAGINQQTLGVYGWVCHISSHLAQP